MLLLIALPLTPAPAQVYLEDSPDAAQLAREAAAQQTQGHLGQAAALLHRLSTDFGNRLMEREPNHYTQATRWVRQQLILNPPLRQAYRKRFDATAIHAWQAAHDSPNPQAALANVARQFGATGPGRDATLDLAARQVRMGNGHAAALLLADIADLPEFIALTPDHTPRHTPSDAQAAQRYPPTFGMDRRPSKRFCPPRRRRGSMGRHSQRHRRQHTAASPCGSHAAHL